MTDPRGPPSASIAATPRPSLAQITDLPARELVPGDLVELTAGARVPADVRVLELRSFPLWALETALTGEAAPVPKDAAAVGDPDAEVADRRCMLFAGTHIVTGSCSAVVTSVGQGTEYGRMRAAAGEAGGSPDDEVEQTPLAQQVRGEEGPQWFMAGAARRCRAGISWGETRHAGAGARPECDSRAQRLRCPPPLRACPPPLPPTIAPRTASDAWP